MSKKFVSCKDFLDLLIAEEYKNDAIGKEDRIEQLKDLQKRLENIEGAMKGDLDEECKKSVKKIMDKIRLLKATEDSIKKTDLVDDKSFVDKIYDTLTMGWNKIASIFSCDKKEKCNVRKPME